MTLFYLFSENILTYQLKICKSKDMKGEEMLSSFETLVVKKYNIINNLSDFGGGAAKHFGKLFTHIRRMSNLGMFFIIENKKGEKMLKTNETGRSMVEMLGVLAVMGVLSITGVAAYTMAMNKHRANELLNAVSVRATALASQRMTGKALSLAGFTDNTQGTSVIDVNSSNAGAIEITITNVPLAVCKNMYNTRGANVIEMKSGTTVLNGAGGCEEGATVSIKFNNDLSQGGSSSGSGSSNQQQNNSCANYDAQCCNDGDISSTAVCNYGNGTNNGLCNSGKCKQITYTCGDNEGYYRIINAITGDDVGYCPYVGGCKTSSITTNRWLDICGIEVPNGYYLCTEYPHPLNIYNSNGELVGSCGGNCYGIDSHGNYVSTSNEGGDYGYDIITQTMPECSEYGGSN